MKPLVDELSALEVLQRDGITVHSMICFSQLQYFVGYLRSVLAIAYLVTLPHFVEECQR